MLVSCTDSPRIRDRFYHTPVLATLKDRSYWLYTDEHRTYFAITGITSSFQQASIGNVYFVVYLVLHVTTVIGLFCVVRAFESSQGSRQLIMQPDA